MKNGQNAITIGCAKEIGTIITITNAISNAVAYNDVIDYAIGNTNATLHAINRCIKYAQWSLGLEIYEGLDLQEEIDKLEKMKSEIPDKNQYKREQHTFAFQLIQTWLRAFHLTPDMVDLSDEELESLDNYLYANLLLIECERAAVRRSPEVWSQIEERMLRPF
jgi:hypothetical protein